MNQQAPQGASAGRTAQLERVPLGGKRISLILYLAYEPKQQYPRVIDRLSAACNLLNYLPLPAAQAVEVPLVKLNVASLAVHGTDHLQKRVRPKILEARVLGSTV
jgi:hypothetical protein